MTEYNAWRLLRLYDTGIEPTFCSSFLTGHSFVARSVCRLWDAPREPVVAAPPAHQLLFRLRTRRIRWLRLIPLHFSSLCRVPNEWPHRWSICVVLLGVIFPVDAASVSRFWKSIRVDKGLIQYTIICAFNCNKSTHHFLEGKETSLEIFCTTLIGSLWKCLFLITGKRRDLC